MEDGTREDYLLLDESERRYAQGLPDRVLESLKQLDHCKPPPVHCGTAPMKR